MSLIKRNQEKRKNSKILFKKIKKQVQGITLIALVVTVIVLLILAGVAINLTVGNNGLFRRAQNAADTYQEASEIEAIEFAVAGMQIGSTQGNNMTKTELENSLKEQFGDEASVEDNEDGSFLVTIGENQYYVGEDGEIIDSSNMVEISTAEELKAFRDDVNSGNTYEGKYVYLANDITLDINEIWEPIGLHRERTGESESEPFKGIFNGNGFEIDYIKIDSLGYSGLFGFVQNAVIKNIGIGRNCDMTNCENGTHIGAVVGFLYDKSTIKNCYNLSTISGDEANEIGGIVGTTNLNCNIYNCFNKGNVLSNVTDVLKSQVGGIVGNLISGNVINCYNTALIKCTRRWRNSWNYME